MQAKQDGKGSDEVLMMKRSWQMQLDPKYDGSLECKSVKSSKVHGIMGVDMGTD
jgi:hypothetical protein